MRILMIEAPWIHELSDGSTRVLVSLGIGYLVSSLKKAHHECNVLNLSLHDSFSIVSDEISAFMPDVVGVSCTTDTFNTCLNISAKIKKLYNDMLIIIGGVHTTVIGGHKIIENYSNFFDFAIEGEGEYSLPLLLSAIESNGDYEIPGVTYIVDGVIFSTPRELIKDLDNLDFPDRTLIRSPSISSYNDSSTDVSILSSRGCSYDCRYCSIAQINKSRWRFRSPNNVILEVEQIVSLYGTDVYLHFIDDNFFVDRSRAIEIISEIHNRWPTIIMSFATRADLIIQNHKFLPLLKKCGVISIELGIENGSDSVLLRYGKGISVNDNLKAIELLKQNGISLDANYILFDYLLTPSELKENLNFLKESGLWGHYPPLVYSRLVLYPNTLSSIEWEKRTKNQVDLESSTIVKFVNSDIDEIFSKISLYKHHISSVFRIISICREQEIAQSQNLPVARLIVKRLSNLPYEILESLYLKICINKEKLHRFDDEYIQSTIATCEQLTQNFV